MITGHFDVTHSGNLKLCPNILPIVLQVDGAGQYDRVRFFDGTGSEVMGPILVGDELEATQYDSTVPPKYFVSILDGSQINHKIHVRNATVIMSG